MPLLEFVLLLRFFFGESDSRSGLILPLLLSILALISCGCTLFVSLLLIIWKFSEEVVEGILPLLPSSREPFDGLLSTPIPSLLFCGIDCLMGEGVFEFLFP